MMESANPWKGDAGLLVLILAHVFLLLTLAVAWQCKDLRPEDPDTPLSTLHWRRRHLQSLMITTGMAGLAVVAWLLGSAIAGVQV